MRKEKLVLFDVGGVLLELNYSAFYEEGARLIGATPEKFKEIYINSRLEIDLLRGRISDEDYQDKFKQLIGKMDMDRVELEKFRSKVFEKEIKSIVDLKGRIYFESNNFVGIFSNICQFVWEYISGTYPRILQTFNPQAPIICSYISKDIKPNTPMYQDAQNATERLECNRTILIDDKEAYVKAGIENFGWNGILFTPYQDPVEAIKSFEEPSAFSFCNPNFKRADTIEELEEALRDFGIRI